MNSKIRKLEEELADLKTQLSEARRLCKPEPISDYTLEDKSGSVTLRELFGGQSDLLIIHNMGRECDYCTLWADGFNGLLPHILDRAAFALVSPDDPFSLREFAAARGWRFRVASARNSSFTQDLGFATNQTNVPGVSAFRMDETGAIYRTGLSTFGPMDDYCPVWPLFDLLSNGSEGWRPRPEY